MAIEPIQPNGLPPAALPLGGTPASSGASPAGDFKALFKRQLDEVNALQFEADKAVRDLSAGRAGNLHAVIAAVTEADLSFRLMMQVRNRLVEAYKEIMRMQV